MIPIRGIIKHTLLFARGSNTTRSITIASLYSLFRTFSHPTLASKALIGGHIQPPCSIRYSSTKAKPKMTDATNHPLSGLWQPTQLQKLHYGADSVKQHLLSCLPKESSKAFVITGNSLASKTPLVKQVEALLGDKHAGTFSKIGEHAPVASTLR